MRRSAEGETPLADVAGPGGLNGNPEKKDTKLKLLQVRALAAAHQCCLQKAHRLRFKYASNTVAGAMRGGGSPVHAL